MQLNEKYQLLDALRSEEYAALEADIGARGVMIPVELDEHGSVLDGHHRKTIATKLGVDCPTVVRRFETEQAKLEHVLKLNLARRHLQPYEWGLAFKKLLEVRGVKTTRGPKHADGISDTVSEIASELGVEERTARRRLAQADAYEALPDEQQRQVANREATIRQAQREARKSTTHEPSSLPPGKYRVIYADPPWSYGDKLTDSYGGTQHHYPTMSLPELNAMPVRDLVADDAVLFLWATSPLLPDALDLAASWGFAYKASFVWDKLAHNFGHYQSVRHEFLLLCTAGKCLPDSDRLEPSVIRVKRTTHSTKPQEARAMIERMYRGPRIELFARTKHPEWECWGNQL